MKNSNGKIGCAKAFAIFWLAIFSLAFVDEHPVLAVIMALVLVYVVFPEPINSFLNGSLDLSNLLDSGKSSKNKRSGSASNRSRNVEVSTYKSVIGDYIETPVAYIAEVTGLKQDKVINDLIRLSDDKILDGGHFDDKGNFIMPFNNKRRDVLKESDAKVSIKCPFCGEKIPASLKFCYYCGEPLDVIKEIDTIRVKTVAELKDSAEKVPEGDTRDCIVNIADLTDKIIRKYEEEPELIKDSSKFREFYLPNTVNAIENYGELCSHENLDQDEQGLKEQIEKSLPTIEEAFSRILKKISIDGVFDLSADVSTLETVLKQDGLTKSDFE